MTILPIDAKLSQSPKDYLGSEELQFWVTLPPAKQPAYLGGRKAVKTAIINYFALHQSRTVTYSDLLIQNDGFGRPSFEITIPNIDPNLYAVSISHCQQFAAGEICLRASGRLGIDIEQIREFPPIVREKFLTSNESVWLKNQPAAEQLRLTTLFWSLKESYLKALGQGLRIHPVKVEITHSSEKTIIKHENIVQKVDTWYTYGVNNTYIVTKVIIKNINNQLDANRR